MVPCIVEIVVANANMANGATAPYQDAKAAYIGVSLSAGPYLVVLNDNVGRAIADLNASAVRVRDMQPTDHHIVLPIKNNRSRGNQ